MVGKIWVSILTLLGKTPTEAPTPLPSSVPSQLPSPAPNLLPTGSPITGFPTFAPSTNAPTMAPSTPDPTTVQPSVAPVPQPPLPDRFSCPTELGGTVEFRLVVPFEVTLARPTTDEYLCTLHLERSDGSLVPVARTYDGHGWERYGGDFAAQQVPDEWSCDDTDCRTVLPPSYENFFAQGKYVLQTRAGPLPVVVVEQEEKARFYEAATFGLTPELLASNLAFETYIKEQQEVVPLTSHREFYRRNMNPMWRFHKPQFAAALDPCERGRSYWRRYILTVKDVGKEVQVADAGGGSSALEILIEGLLRAVVPALRYANENNDTIPVGNYTVCSSAAQIHRNDFRLQDSGGDCQPALTDDLIVDFSDTFEPDLMLAGGSLPSLQNETAWQLLPGLGEDYLNIAATLESSCDSLPDFVYNETAIFAQTVDGDWLQFTPRIQMDENTVDNPNPNGGVDLWSDGETHFCGNVPISFLNEKGCILSTVEACSFGSTHPDNATIGTLICGSPNEVANDPSTGDSRLDVSSIDTERMALALGLEEDTTSGTEFARQREFIWQQLALRAPDQLRQRMAWALFQIFSFNKVDIRGEDKMTEAFVKYNDIFVRNAFGNFFDVLREIAYSPIMGENLSYINSRSSGVLFIQFRGAVIFPDENFARELMQLFSIGLVMLQEDGTPILDPSTKEPLRTYGLKDIESFSRAWTGFEAQTRRANVEKNLIDPMTIKAAFRDRFPKTNLYDGHIGDGFPLCSDLPDKAFLRIGAKYRLLGSSPNPHMIIEDPAWASLSNLTRLAVLDGASGLYDLLCAPGTVDGLCKYPAVVTLESNLDCTGVTATECNVDTVSVVEVEGIYYEYIRQPCIEFPFFENARVVTRDRSTASPTCANPELSVAGAACCASGSATAQPTCEFAGERMDLSTAEARCMTIGLQVCSYDNMEASTSCPHSMYTYNWRTDVCSVKAKINLEGDVAVYHESALGRPEALVRNETVSFFGVYWTGPYPNALNGCGGGSCVREGSTCFCDVSVTKASVFTSRPGRLDVLSELKVGHPAPATFNLNEYQSQSASGVTVYSRDGSCCDEDTVFEVSDENDITRFFLNFVSTVTIVGTSSSFRNPPQFNSVLTPEYSVADAEHETDAVLQHLFYHPNTAPFLATRFIQRFGHSSPSPRYVKVAAQAFKQGSFVFGNQTFGSGQYGDLAAMSSAILLDREHRSARLLKDPFLGALREPIIKVIAFLRALQFEKIDPLLELDLLNTKIGEAPYEQPTVFNFWKPEFSPPGPAARALVDAPEAEVMWAGRVVGLLNGLFGIIQQTRLSTQDCDRSGFGRSGACSGFGSLAYEPIDITNRTEYMEELSILLTGGRLSEGKQLAILDAISGQDSIPALDLALQLILTTPEFNSYNAKDAFGVEPPAPPSKGAPGSEYKAVIHIMLFGGCDSFNVLVPRNTIKCARLRNDYDFVRGLIGTKDSILNSQTLPLDAEATATGQPCDDFGVHDKLPVLQELFNASDLLFLANTGILTTPVTKADYRFRTRTPLFSHNSGTAEVNTLDPFNSNVGTGTLGRVADVLDEAGYLTGRTSIGANPENLAGSSVEGSPIVALDADGVKRFIEPDLTNIDEVIALLNGNGTNAEQSGLYGGVWSTILQTSLQQVEKLADILSDPANEPETTFSSTGMSRRMKLVAQLIKSRSQRGVDRDFFFVTMGGFDMHKDVLEQLDKRFDELNPAIEELVTELKALGVWDDVTIVQTSDFGRTLTGNSGSGTDHGWGGNYWVAGGAVRGKRILGRYPSTLTDDGAEILGRGRVIPSTPWDSVFNAISEWMGADLRADLDRILPNRNKFRNLFSKGDFFV